MNIITFSEMHDDEIRFPIYVCDGKDKYDCFSTDIPPMKKGNDPDAVVTDLHVMIIS